MRKWTPNKRRARRAQCRRRRALNAMWKRIEADLERGATASLIGFIESLPGLQDAPKYTERRS